MGVRLGRDTKAELYATRCSGGEVGEFPKIQFLGKLSGCAAAGSGWQRLVRTIKFSFGPKPSRA
jgi:hypothetical protein